MNYKNRSRGALYGLAIGDSLGWPAFYHRTHTLPFWTRRLRREIDVAQEAQGVIRFPMPFSLNRPTEALQFGPTDDTEWVSFTIITLLEMEGQLTSEILLEKWKSLTELSDIKGSISIMGALHNLRLGTKPPVTGRDNAHYFDDSACLRAVPIGIALRGDREGILATVEIDAAVTNAKDGLWAAQAVAIAIGELCIGVKLEDALGAAQDVLPRDSWVYRSVNEAMRVAKNAEDGNAFALIPTLDLLINKEYSYGGAAPEVIALAFAITYLASCDPKQGIMYSLAFPKLADSLPALVGALCGAGSDQGETFYESWLPVIRNLRGVCLPHMAGWDYVSLVDEFIDLAERLRNEEGR